MDPVPDPLFLRKSGRAGNRTRISGYVARNSDHSTTDAVLVYNWEEHICFALTSLSRTFEVSQYVFWIMSLTSSNYHIMVK
jgi:hypothetical protein